MRFWRICRRKYAAADGEGARLYGGRWNSRGIAVVYGSSSLALAAMEYFVNLEPNLRPRDLVSIAGEVPASFKIVVVDPQTLPTDWRRTRDESLQQIGDSWIKNAKSVALKVPSAAVSGEWNLLLNPNHKDFSKVRFEKPVPFEFDLRMFR